MLFEDRVARFVDRENLRVNRVALGVTYAPRLLDTNLHDDDSKHTSSILAQFGASEHSDDATEPPRAAYHVYCRPKGRSDDENELTDNGR